jgi:mRNA-degrading endonuclease RelE of RelBE toxin-antitoxin system
VKFPHIDDDLRPIFEDFTNGVFHGNKENKFKFPVYKLRIASRDLQAGRQGGFRLIY